MKRSFTSLVCASLVMNASFFAHAELWIDTKDVYLRADLQFLASQGVLRAPINTYPLRWQSVADALQQVDVAELPASTAQVYQRVLQHYQQSLATQSGYLRASVASDAAQFRRFGSDYREKSELTANTSYQHQSFAAKLTVTAVSSADDQKKIRPDDSYVAWVLDEWTLSAGYLEQWWGPAMDSALHKSNNARPMPAVMLTGYQAVKDQSPWLAWLGPWTFHSAISRFEQERAVANPLLWSNRFSVVPWQPLEIGLSFTAQMCGEGFACNLKTFTDLLTSTTECPATNPNCLPEERSHTGNKMAGFDLHYRTQWWGQPFSLYYERTCEDSKGDSVLDISDCANMAGGSTWFALPSQQVQVFIEYSDTMVACSEFRKNYNCFYEHSTYGSGSRYYRRSLGSTYDSDARTWAFGAITRFADQSGLYTSLRNIKLNYDGIQGGNQWTPTIAKQEILQLDVNYQQPLWHGTIKLGANTARIDFADLQDKNTQTLYTSYQYGW